MGSPVPLIPITSTLDDTLVDRTVSGTVGARWARQMAFLHCRAVQPVASLALYGLDLGTLEATVNIQYRRSPGCRAVLLSVLPGFDGIDGGRPKGHLAILSLTLPTAVTVILADRFDGTRTVPQQSPFRASRSAVQQFAVLDVSELSTESIVDIRVSIDDAGGANLHGGFAQIHLIEMPLDEVNPGANEPGVLVNWPDPRNRLEDGNLTTSTGMRRLLHAELSAAYECRPHWQIATYESSTLSFISWMTLSAAFAPINWSGTLGSSLDPTFVLRAKRLYNVVDGDLRTLRVRYTGSAGGQLKLKLTAKGKATQTTTLTLGAHVGADFVEAKVNVVVPTDGTDQEVAIQFEARTNNADHYLFISSIALIGAYEMPNEVPGDLRLTESAKPRITEDSLNRITE